ncbi:hydrolase [Halonotius terrestris]|uniref:Hydrolase n=1 Tax=Halonotius terrestris TaxID=2487750 RepID=A0A8J8TBL3_9EURY|nr:hydrolase [Halonotius terrestris]TQQ79152.1 hydrolase [Halonotius terrestris]
MLGERSKFEAHFLNVDHGDCTIIHHPGDEKDPEGRVTFVDINDWKHKQDADVAGLGYFLKNLLSSKGPESEEEYAYEYLNSPVDYFQNNIDDGGKGVWRFIATHPDMDHLSGLEHLDNKIEITEFWDTFHKKTLSAEQDNWPERFDPNDWRRYEEIRHGKTNHHYIQPTKGTKTSTWKEDDIDILHPSSPYIQQLNKKYADRADENYNRLSYVLKINTPAGGILLPGDIEGEDAWRRVLEYAEDDLEDIRVLKAAHHGRQNGFNEEAVKKIDPDFVILSVGKKTEHDAQADYNRVCDNQTEIYSTRQHGRIKITVEEGELDIDLEHPDGIFDLP